MINEIIHGDCLEVMEQISAGSVDMILCDLPYGTTQNSWDSAIPFDPLWQEYERIIKPNGAIVLTASQPFTSALILSNPKLFKYEWIWEKDQGTGHLNAKIMPLKIHENVLVFAKGPTTYNPQLTKGKPYKHMSGYVKGNGKSAYGEAAGYFAENDGVRYPVSVVRFQKEHGLHGTQKPVNLFRYLIETYTNENELVLDNCIGSGTTAVAAASCNRNFIGIEKEIEYVEVARKRLQVVQPVINF